MTAFAAGLIIGLALGAWAAWNMTEARTAAWMAKNWDELGRRADSPAGVGPQDVIDVFGQPRRRR